MHSRGNVFGYSAIVVFAIVLCTCSVNAEDVDMTTTTIQEGRSFGHHFLKRISFAMIPAAFVVGVITTILASLTIVSMKGLGVGVILLVIAVGQLFSRLVPAPAPVAYAAPPAPYPVVYARKSPEPYHSIPTLPYAAADPVWIEGKDW